MIKQLCTLNQYSKATPPKTTQTLRAKPTFNHKRQKKGGVAGDVSTVVGVQNPSPHTRTSLLFCALSTIINTVTDVLVD